MKLSLKTCEIECFLSLKTCKSLKISVFISALQTNWERAPASSEYTVRPCPIINDKTRFVFGDEGRKIRVYDRLDTYLMFEDMFAKIGNK